MNLETFLLLTASQTLSIIIGVFILVTIDEYKRNNK